ncbi:hypothetical protein ACFE04_030139 [Oxalis oulophora]
MAKACKISSQLIRTTARLDDHLRLVNIIAPKPKPPSNTQTHLRLIQDFLQTDSVTTVSKEDHDHHHDHPSTHFGTDFVEYPSEFMLSSSVKQCALSRDICNGVKYHSLGIKTGFFANVFVGTTLVTMYGRCGQSNNAYKVFEEMPEKNEVSWTAIIDVFSKESRFEDCMEIYRMMKRSSDYEPNHFTYTSVLSACTDTGALGQGRNTHCHIIQTGFSSYIHVVNALISMYCKCGNLAEAFYLFNTTRRKDTISLLLVPGCVATHIQLANLYASVGYWDQAAGIRKMMRDKGLKTNPGCSWIEIKDKSHKFVPEDKSDPRMTEILSIMECLVDDMKNLGRVPELCGELVD